jgi:hypothetical protein
MANEPSTRITLIVAGIGAAGALGAAWIARPSPEKPQPAPSVNVVVNQAQLQQVQQVAQLQAVAPIVVVPGSAEHPAEELGAPRAGACVTPPGGLISRSER